MKKWQVNLSDIVYETPWFKIHRDEVLNQNGTPLTYSYMELQNHSVGIMAMDRQNRILLQKNYRYTIDRSVWEIPAGFSDGEDLLVAAKRELMEEAGLASDEWTSLGNFYIAPGVGNIQQHYFLAKNVHAAEGERDPDEPISDQAFFALDDIERMLLRNEINSYMAPIGVYLAKLHLQKEIK